MSRIPPRFQRVGLILSLVALVFASGSQWTLLQGVAWARMIVAYAQEGTLGDAIEQTFSGQRPCPLCHQAQKGQHRNSEKAPWQPSASVLELLPVPADSWLTMPAPCLAWLLGTDAVAPHSPCHSPPKPPPRVA